MDAYGCNGCATDVYEYIEIHAGAYKFITDACIVDTNIYIYIHIYVYENVSLSIYIYGRVYFARW